LAQAGHRAHDRLAVAEPAALGVHLLSPPLNGNNLAKTRAHSEATSSQRG
jgi:hypothetical protein